MECNPQKWPVCYMFLFLNLDQFGLERKQKYLSQQLSIYEKNARFNNYLGHGTQPTKLAGVSYVPLLKLGPVRSEKETEILKPAALHL